MDAPGEQHQRAAKSRQHGGHERGRHGQRAGARFEAKMAHSRKLHRPEDERCDACPRTNGERAGPSASGPHVHASVVALVRRPHGYPRRNPAQLRAVESAARGLPIPSWLAVLRAARFDTVEQGLRARTQGATRLAKRIVKRLKKDPIASSRYRWLEHGCRNGSRRYHQDRGSVMIAAKAARDAVRSPVPCR